MPLQSANDIIILAFTAKRDGDLTKTAMILFTIN
jgi:hypothetical protein